MDKHDRGEIYVGPAVGWVHLGVDSFAIVGVDVDLAWLHGWCVGAGWSVRKDRRYTYTMRLKIGTGVLRTFSCRADLRLGAVKSGGSPAAIA